MKTITYIIGILIVGVALWGSARLDKVREKAFEQCVRWEVDYTNNIVCAEYE